MAGSTWRFAGVSRVQGLASIPRRPGARRDRHADHEPGASRTVRSTSLPTSRGMLYSPRRPVQETGPIGSRPLASLIWRDILDRRSTTSLSRAKRSRMDWGSGSAPCRCYRSTLPRGG